MSPPSTSPPTITPPTVGSSAGPNYNSLSGSNPFATSGTQPTDTGQIFSPDANVSQYQLGNIEGASVNLGGIGGTSGSTTIQQALAEFYDLPPAMLVQLEQALWEAGFYTDAGGAPLQTAPQFGSPDAASFRAYSMALIATNNAAQTDPSASLLNVIQQRITSGVGTKNETQLPTGIVGGGNNYAIDLTNPADVNLTADQIAQKLLGRNANAKEKADILSVLQGQQTSAANAKIAGAEAASREMYDAQVNKANSDFQYETTPKLAGGPVPTGSNIRNSADFAVDLLTYMKMPTTASNVAAITALADKMGSTGLNNPLGATLDAQGSQAGVNGVQSYANYSSAIQATAEQLLASYPTITAMLQTGTTNLSDSKVSGELSKWSNGAFTSVDTSSALDKAQQALTDASTVQPPSSPAGLTAGQRAQFNDANQSDPGALVTGTSQPATVAGSGGQQQSNPADAYVPATVTTVTDPASAEAVAYQEDTTGANRPEYLGNNYLGLYQALLQAIKSGGPAQQ